MGRRMVSFGSSIQIKAIRFVLTTPRLVESESFEALLLQLIRGMRLVTFQPSHRCARLPGCTGLEKVLPGGIGAVLNYSTRPKLNSQWPYVPTESDADGSGFIADGQTI
jgi:hypothetical protein